MDYSRLNVGADMRIQLPSIKSVLTMLEKLKGNDIGSPQNVLFIF